MVCRAEQRTPRHRLVRPPGCCYGPNAVAVRRVAGAGLPSYSSDRPPVPKPSAIVVEGLGKEYQLGKQHRRETLREALTGLATSPLRRFRTLAGRTGDDRFWALKDLTFDVPQGEVLGVIGRNGAGKSTLLKILSRITDPTEGRVAIRGRVSSLLEVGTGFHPELTGRENMYLNAAILGMRRSELRRRFDEIVAFAGVERFLDTPIKRYSSGMKVRLAFAVAAHLEPEILIIDEVLAVGDQEFQNRCLGKMDEVAGSGRTVLFVSHNMAAVERLCTRGLLLANGTMQAHGEIGGIIRRYLAAGQESGHLWLRRSSSTPDRASADVARTDGDTEPPAAELQRVVLTRRPAESERAAWNGSDPEPLQSLATGEAAAVAIDVHVHRPLPDLKLAACVFDDQLRPVFSTHPVDSGCSYPDRPGRFRYVFELPDDLLMPRRYSLTVSAYTMVQPIDTAPHALQFEVQARDSRALQGNPKRPGTVFVPCRWERAELAAVAASEPSDALEPAGALEPSN